MSTTRNRIEITAALFLGAVLVMASPSSAYAQHDRRERELQEQQELRELEMQRARLEVELAEIEAAQRRLQERHRPGDEEAEQRHLSIPPELAKFGLEHELHELRLKESELRAIVEKMELAGRHDEARAAQQELVGVRHEMELRDLEIDRLLEPQRREAERRELAMMTDRLGYVDNWHRIAFDPQRAVMMATQAIVEIHMASGQPDQAVEMLEGLLERVEEQGSRTAIRFALRDVFMERGEPERAAEHMVQIILENSGGAR